MIRHDSYAVDDTPMIDRLRERNKLIPGIIAYLPTRTKIKWTSGMLYSNLLNYGSIFAKSLDYNL